MSPLDLTCDNSLSAEGEVPPGHSPPPTNSSSPPVTSRVGTSLDRRFLLAASPPVLPPPRPLSPMDMSISDWGSYKSPPWDGVGFKRRRDSCARSPPEAPARKKALRTDSVPPTDSQPVPPPPTARDSPSGLRSPQGSPPPVEPAPKPGQVSIPDQPGGLDGAGGDDDATEGGRRIDVESRVAAPHVESVGPTSQIPPVPPSPDVAAGGTSQVSARIPHASRDLIIF